MLNILNHTAKRTYKANALMTYSSQGELITFRYRGLHTEPSASDKNMDTPFGVSIFLPPVIYTIIYVCILKMSPSRILIVLLIFFGKVSQIQQTHRGKKVLKK